jgi:hypothetical protein
VCKNNKKKSVIIIICKKSFGIKTSVGAYLSLEGEIAPNFLFRDSVETVGLNFTFFVNIYN